MEHKNFACQCCRFLTLEEDPWGSYEICEVCFWENNHVQFNDPTYRGGANKVSLLEARKNFEVFGAKEERLKTFVRSPSPDEYPS